MGVREELTVGEDLDDGEDAGENEQAYDEGGRVSAFRNNPGWGQSMTELEDCCQNDEEKNEKADVPQG